MRMGEGTNGEEGRRREKARKVEGLARILGEICPHKSKKKKGKENFPKSV